MPDVRLKFNGGELAPKDGVTTLGRTSDNDVAFPGDSNVSRYHAEIESRGGEFCLIDLNSSNGTTVNGIKVSGETYLKPGDRILLGGTSEVVFAEPETPAEEKSEPAATAPASTVGPPPVGSALNVPSLASSASSASSSPASGSRTMLMIAGGAVLIALIVVGVTGAIYYTSVSSRCDAKAKILKPETGDTIYSPTEIEVEAENSECVASAVFTLDGKEFANAKFSPYTATLDPKNHPELADGNIHSLGMLLIDEDGNQISQSGEVMLALETRKVEKPKQEEPTAQDPQQPTEPAGPKGKEVSLIDIQRMATQYAGQFSGARTMPNKQFVQDVQKMTGQYAQDGYFDRAAAHRDRINVAFVKENNLPAALGFVLAMSRSGLDPKKQGAEEGLWRLSPALIESQKFGGDCGGESLSDPKQVCASRAAAAYMKELFYTACGGDAMCTVAAFGKPVQDAIAWKSGLGKGDVWNAVKPGPERDQLVRFFAAGIVAENPQRFGLKRDKPISGLYP